MLHHEEKDISRATRAVRTAGDDLQLFRASRQLQLPLSLRNVAKALESLSTKLDVLAGLLEARSIFRGWTLNADINNVETPLSDAIVHDMEATATYFRAMMLEGSNEIPATVSEQECQNIKKMIDRYETVLSTILNRHEECVRVESTGCMCPLLIHTRSPLSLLTAQGRELQEDVDAIRRQQAEQQSSEMATMRTSESASVPMSVRLTLVCSQRGPRQVEAHCICLL
jgi:hypothetical protein